MRHRDAIAHGLRRAFRIDLGRDRARERELDDEIRFHIEQRVTELIARGLPADRARAEAFARFGPYEESREQLLESARSRDEVLTMIDRLDNFRADARYALRQLVRSPGLSAAIAVTFALGIGANATMFAVIDRLLLQPPAYVAHPEAIAAFAYGLEGSPADQYAQQTMNYPVFRALRDHASGFGDVSATYDSRCPSAGANRLRTHAACSSPAIISICSAPRRSWVVRSVPTMTPNRRVSRSSCSRTTTGRATSPATSACLAGRSTSRTADSRSSA
jgi:hypothetical protein